MAAASTEKVFTIGLKSLKAGAVDETTGVMPASGMETHGNVYRDTMDIATSDTTFNDFFEEEIDGPVATEATLGETTLTWEILRPSVSDLAYWAGGTADGNVWNAPDEYTDIKKAIEVESKQGYKISFPKTQVSANIVGGGTKSTPMRLRVSCKVLVPTTSAGVDKSPMIVTGPAASSNP